MEGSPATDVELTENYNMSLQLLLPLSTLQAVYEKQMLQLFT